MYTITLSDMSTPSTHNSVTVASVKSLVRAKSIADQITFKPHQRSRVDITKPINSAVDEVVYSRIL